MTGWVASIVFATISVRDTKASDSIFKEPRRSDIVIARSEATKQSILSLCGTMDCFASLAMTSGVDPPPRGADSARAFAPTSSLEKQRAQGMPGARCTRGLACESKRAHERSHHRFTGITRHSLHNGFNGLLRALPGDRAFLPPSPARRVGPVRADIAIPQT
jgi:hypothetical protein